MKPIRVRDIILEAPAIEKPVFEAVEGTDPADLKQLTNYGWCDIEKVRISLNDRLRRFGGPTINDSRDIFMMYGLLNGHKGGIPKVTWHTHSCYELYGDPPPESLSRIGVYVPAKWVLNLLRITAASFVHITWRQENCKQFSSPFVSTCMHFVGIKIDGSEHEISDLGGKYRVVSLDGLRTVSVV